MIEFEQLRDMREAHALVERYHYSGRAVRNSSFCIVGRQDARLEAACFIYSPATRWSQPVMELCRLVKVPGSSIPLTSLLSVALRIVREAGVDLLVSFADVKQGHHGGIYQAASWNYAGVRGSSCDGFFIEGVFTPRRSCNERYGTSSFGKLSDILSAQGKTCVKHMDDGKHLFWKALNKKGRRKAKALKLKALDYYKPIGREAAEMLRDW